MCMLYVSRHINKHDQASVSYRRALDVTVSRLNFGQVIRTYYKRKFNFKFFFIVDTEFTKRLILEFLPEVGIIFVER